VKEGEVADRNRGGRSVDDEFDDESELDVEADDESQLDADYAEEDEDEEAAEPSARTRARSRVATRRPAKAARTKSPDARRGILARLVLFVREVVAELQKVIWPTRKELITYTTVVVVFVAVMMTLVALLDVGFAQLMFLVFGRKTSGQ
jgi:preprotein translocase subunit SecE